MGGHFDFLKIDHGKFEKKNVKIFQNLLMFNQYIIQFRSIHCTLKIYNKNN